MMRNQSDSIHPELQHMEDSVYNSETAATPEAGSIVYQLGSSVLGSCDMFLQNIQNGTSNNTFTAFWNSTVAAE